MTAALAPLAAGPQVRFIRQTAEKLWRRHVHFSPQDLCGSRTAMSGWSTNELRTSGSARSSPDEKGKGHAVVKFSPEGKVLLTLGKPGVEGNPPDALTEPTSVVTAPNGDIFIAEGHQGRALRRRRIPWHASPSSRRTASSSNPLASWGSGPGEFRTPHDIAMDPQGRLFVADRGNMRIQISRSGREVHRESGSNSAARAASISGTT